MKEERDQEDAEPIQHRAFKDRLHKTITETLFEMYKMIKEVLSIGVDNGNPEELAAFKQVLYREEISPISPLVSFIASQ